MAIRLCFVLSLISLVALSDAAYLPFITRHWVPNCLREPKLVCQIRPTKGNRVTGTLVFSNVRNPIYRVWQWNSNPCRVKVTGSIKRLTPGKHGMHVHSYGDERDATGSSLGPHFPNPWFIPTPHGLPNDAKRHWGDFGNFRANSRGFAPVHYVDRLVTLRGIVGRGIVVHGGEDMGKNFQPSGMSGPRVATCVIGFANPELK